ncbi:MAG TPA: J domain-containing protein [Stellaceae bacterium]|nr:J domain-containing protein [Stellaceae bacterium]
MTLDTALILLRRLGVDVSSLSRQDFSTAYYCLARRYHPDRNQATAELMANINAARTCVLKSYRWTATVNG